MQNNVHINKIIYAVEKIKKCCKITVRVMDAAVLKNRLYRLEPFKQYIIAQLEAILASLSTFLF
jgi:hypothetical protein